MEQMVQADQRDREAKETPENALTDDEAVREVGWVARRARELVGQGSALPTPAQVDEWAEFHDRKARLLRHIGESDLAAQSESAAAAYKPGGAYYPRPT
jgi:hypothetical protein